ncbi:MAG: hypothetical protein IPM64_05755 [Phycisphaerales bacterium]|nr:hypothetical protein [Phycisphaerales bacterium]
MPRLPQEQVEALSAAIRSHDFLHRILRQIEVLQRTVFHANERADWTQTRRSAEQMLIAELALRYRGDIDRVYFRLREIEKSGRDWAAAITELASAIHSYFTTPLGMVLRRDLYGEDAAYLSPDAIGWMAQIPAAAAPGHASAKAAANKADDGRPAGESAVRSKGGRAKPAVRASKKPASAGNSAKASAASGPKRAAAPARAKSSGKAAPGGGSRAKSSKSVRATRSAGKGKK